LAEVKWIKITTDIFDDEKVLLIESLPDAYAIITVWFKLLCLAGKQNNSGVFMMNNQIAYTNQMLATIFRMKESTVTMALQTFEQFGMVEIIDGVITIPNWNKHQSLDAYEKKKVRDRLYQAERRAAQKALIEKSSDKSSDIAFSDKDIEEDKDKDNNILPDSPSSKPKKPAKHKHGEFQKVRLTDEELQKLTDEYGDILTLEAITFLDEYIAEKGYKSQSHYLAIRRWVIEAVQDRKKKPATNNAVKPKNSTDDFMNQLQQMYNEEC
jgi:predicted phage replisome organizer